MGTVTPANAGLNDLLQTLSSVGSPLTSSLSTPALQSALQNASPADIVKLSDAALQLQTTDELFGVTNSSGSSSPLSALQSLTAGSTADQAAAAQANTQAQETAALFGASTATSSSFDVMA